MKKGFQIYEAIRKYLVICEEAVTHDMTMQPLPSGFPYVWGKFSFLFYQCGGLMLELGLSILGVISMGSLNNNWIFECYLQGQPQKQLALWVSIPRATSARQLSNGWRPVLQCHVACYVPRSASANSWKMECVMLKLSQCGSSPESALTYRWTAGVILQMS